MIASHAYGGPEDRRAVAALAARRGPPLWMTEWVSACARGDCPDDPSIGFALRWAEQIHADITAGARAWFTFRGVADVGHGADGGIVLRDITQPDVGSLQHRGDRLASAERPRT